MFSDSKKSNRKSKKSRYQPQFQAPDYKCERLCAQVQRAVALSLSGDFQDEMLNGLYVEEVAPFPSAGRLLVTVRHWDKECPLSYVQMMERLSQVKPIIRQQVAQAISRKRTPELVFEVLMPGWEGPR